jgi:hypothetical protein
MHLRKNNIKLELMESVDWIHLAQDRPVAASCEHGNESLGSEGVCFTKLPVSYTSHGQAKAFP